jgi:hypothetical protein
MSNINQYREEQVATLLPSGEVSTKSTSTIPSPFSRSAPARNLRSSRRPHPCSRRRLDRSYTSSSNGVGKGPAWVP